MASTMITMIFFSLPRYQIFLVSIYFPVVAIGMDGLLLRWKAKRQKQLPTAAEFAAS